MGGEVIPLGTRLRQRREELGLSQAQAARELAVARTAYRLWEMEAARPAPDRWRVIAKWLGISMTAMLLAGELLNEAEANDAQEAAGSAGLTSKGWDEAAEVSPGDYFSQERTMISEQAAAGRISAQQASGLRHVLSRMQDAALASATHAWHPGRFFKRFPTSRHTPALVRAAVVATAVGVPTAVLDRAALLASELVSNSVRHTDSEWIEVEITLTPDSLRIAVSDESEAAIRARTPDANGGWGLALVSELASGWGVERNATGKTAWAKLDLTAAVS